MLNIQIKNLVDDKKCYEVVRELRWSEGVACHCGQGSLQKSQFN
jgi:hypothetical protein